MGTYDLLLYRMLKERIDEELQTRIDTLSSGSVQTLEEYKAQTGYIKGLTDALVIAQEVNDKLMSDR